MSIPEIKAEPCPIRKSLVLIALLVATLGMIVGGISCSPAAHADSLDEMKLGEFTTVDWFVQTGCVSYEPGKPSYVTFSTIYIGDKDAALQLEHVVDGQWVTSLPGNTHISVGEDRQEERQSYASLTGGARQMIDITVLHVQPQEVWRLVGRHLPNGRTTLLASWSAAERNECSTPPALL